MSYYFNCTQLQPIVIPLEAFFILIMGNTLQLLISSNLKALSQYNHTLHDYCSNHAHVFQNEKNVSK